MRFDLALPLLLGLFWNGGAFAQSTHQSLRKGDAAYDKKEYQQAENNYRKALNQNPKDPAALYNTGNTAYRQGHYEDAVGLYTEAAKQSDDLNLKADALYNLGNTHLQQRQYQKAVEAYEQSLRIRPGDANAKRNLQFAKNKLREEQQKEKQKQQQQQQQDKEQQNQNQQQPPQNDQQQPDNQQQQQPSGQDQNQQPQQPQQQKNTPAQGKLSPEQARQLLDNNIGPADQKSARRYRENVQPRERPRPKKDW